MEVQTILILVIMKGQQPHAPLQPEATFAIYDSYL
jgi:hypothetical protein